MRNRSVIQIVTTNQLVIIFWAHKNVTIMSGYSILHALTKRTSQTLIKTDKAASQAGCNMYLHCTPEIMDFRWNHASLFGINTIHNNADSTCAIEDSSGPVGTKTPTGVDKMWQHPPASCDSTVTREDVDGVE